MSNLCRCGAYIKRHSIVPKANKCSSSDPIISILNRTLKIEPDTEIPINLKCHRIRGILDTDKRRTSGNRKKENVGEQARVAHQINSGVNQATDNILVDNLCPEKITEILKEGLFFTKTHHASPLSFPSLVMSTTIKCLFPYCKRNCDSEKKLKNHIKLNHSIYELSRLLNMTKSQKYMDFNILKHSSEYTLVPPFEPPVILDMCKHHIAPHIKCPQCEKILTKQAPQIPVKFFKRISIKIMPNNSRERAIINLSTSRQDCAALLDSSIDSGGKELCCYQIKAICKDVFNIWYLACQKFISYDELKPDCVSVPSFDSKGYFHKDELCLNSELTWECLDRVRGYAYVLYFSDGKTFQRKLDRGDLYQYTKGGAAVNFYRYVYCSKENRLVLRDKGTEEMQNK